ncbi:ATP-dependent dethiobiotin synthetase BioD 1 [Gimesia panareensis]|uniref:ATP-dependent dethiobiotin synthetase BioD n=1 Tax=Gimesia panareensis TaxID=2527978 RepID=A0A517QF01_9PLAN|nr:dethiobiotin synthase [Gimesia panareensis]QDT30201.1 ATP-dependent dethiobiotin synthetase BioD 1 [Gimesia panareensis]
MDVFPLQIPGFMVVGTDTDVGKTFVSAAIARQLTAEGVRTGVYKPACSGSVADESTGQPCWQDVELLRQAIGATELPTERICPQTFHAPLAPPVAAEKEGRQIDETLLLEGVRWWESQVEFLIVEGVGGVLCPLSSQQLIVDFAEKLQYPLLIVARAGLGTINHSLLTIEVLQQRGLTIAGLILNDVDPELSDESRLSNAEQIQKWTSVPVLSFVPFDWQSNLLRYQTQDRIDWRQLSQDLL